MEDDTPVHIKAGVPWKLELKGGSLVGSSPLMQGSGNKDFTWSGTTGDGKGLRNGTYTMVLTDTSTGEVCQVPVTINAWTLKRELDAFSPNQPTGDGVKDTNHITAQGNGAWTISVDGHPGTAHSGTNTQSFDWDGKVNGIILPDGTYTLRLTPMGTTPNSSDPTAEVSIDTAPPLVADVNAQGHEGTPGTTISATIKDGEQGAGVLQEDIRVTCNDAPIPNEMGVHNYDPATGKFSLELNELDVAALNLPESSTGTVKITAKDKVGNSNKDKDDSFESIGPKDFVDSTTFHVASVGTYNLQAVSVSDTLFRPLLGRINTVTTTVLKPPPNHKLYPYLKGGFLTIIKSPVGRTEAVAFYTYPPWEDHTLQWSGKEPGTLKPVQDGIYKVKGYLFGLVPIKTINVTVDNRRNKDLRDKLSDWNDQKHILWGSKKRRDQGKYHNWSKFNPDINDEVPESNHTLITSLYRNRISQVIDFVMDPENAISEAPSGANGALVEYVKTVQGYRVTVKTKREYDPTTGIIIEKVSDAWVN